MPTNYTGRVILILTVLILALLAIFPPGSLFDSKLTFGEKLALKPGIDMVGGTSLLYEIKPPESGGTIQGNLAEQVMESLKKRVDPDGVRNLIWRPQGNTRLEIQMPMNKQSGESAAKRKEFADAQRQLEATNVRPGDVIRAVEKMTGDERRNRLNELAQGSEKRAKLFGAMASVFDAIEQAKSKQDAAAHAEKELEYDNLKKQIEETNLPASALEAVLGLAAEARDLKLAEIKKQYADFPKRLAAIDQFDKAFTEFSKVKGNLDDAADLKRLLKGSGVLEFHILVPIDSMQSSPDVQAMIQRLKTRGPAVQAGDTMRWYQLDRADELRGQTILDANGKPWALAYITPDKSMTNRAGQPRWALERSTPVMQDGDREVGFTFDAQGAKYFSDLTGANIGKQLAIVLDDKMISAPNIKSRISGSGTISGNKEAGGFGQKEQGYLISTLNAGSLPAQLAEEPISERTVGPQLGADNLRYGLIACGLGLVIVVIFLVSYYYLAGVVATIAVLLNVVIILGVMAMFKATFTLPSVAGIVLTIGAAVDANVLIFERLREEQQRGLSLRMALRNAYDRAWSAIVDSNATTVLTSLFLYWFGSEEVKGFGLTLLIGLTSSLFTALYVTKTIFGLMVDHGGLTSLGSFPLSFPKWDEFLKPNIDWMGKIWWFVGFSAVIVIVGCSAFVIKLNQREMADIEFASGTSVQFELLEPMKIEEVRALLSDKAIEKDLPAPSVVAVGTENRVYELVTPSDKPQVKDAVIKAMGAKLKIERPSVFAQTGDPVELALDRVVLPIKSVDFNVDGFNPPSSASFVGGAAIVLKDLNPPLTPAEIRDRIERQRLLPQAQGGTPVYRDFVVEAEGGPNQPTKMAVILTGDANLAHESDPLKWKEEVAGPMWRLVNESVNKEATLQKVTAFNPQVANDAQRDALLAMVLSIAAIMAYIWMRFGNMKYGTATVVAMIHDTLLVVGFLGLSHLLVDYAPGLARILLIEPFRINLTIVAAVLTVMSYSMIDTIVVFDRVRENRGKFGHLSRKIVNDSINQTLSRTLLTGGTNIVTVLVMYLMGGSGIHGFTFVLLVGILVGTYSSIAIAAPILLIGGDDKNEEPRNPQPPVRQLERVGAV